jgi:GDP-L-fucose synthase
MRILITGSSGLVGSALKNVCEQDTDKNNTYIFLSSKDCDLIDYKATLKTFKFFKPNVVVHLAAKVGGLFKNMNEKVAMFEDNLIMNYNVVKAAHKANVQKLIGCLSTCIFPDDVKYPISETDLHLGAPHNSNFGYAYAKRSLETHCALYREQFRCDYICIIPTNIYGEHDNFHLEDAHVIPALIHKCYLAKTKKRPFIVSGTGKPLRQFIYSQDIAKLINILIHTKRTDLTNIILSVPESDETSIGKIATTIAKEFNYLKMMTYDTTKSDGQYKKTASNTLLQNFLAEEAPDFKFTPIEEGIKQSVRWFIDNYDSARK